MNPRLVARGGAAAVAAICVLFVSGPSFAQFLAPALDRPGFDRRPTQPSLRLVTLGGLSLAIPDENNEIDLWDFGGSTLGLIEDRDSTSLDLHLDTGRQSDKHTLGGATYQVDRATRLLVGMQAVGRKGQSFAAGADVGLLSGTTGTPAEPGTYRNVQSVQPLAVPVANGKMFGGNWGWGARLTFAGQKVNDDLRTLGFIDSGGGTFTFTDGLAVEPPSPFDITDEQNNASGIGLGLGWYGMKDVRVAVNVDRLVTHEHGSFDTQRRIFEIDESQPAGEYSLTATGRTSWVQAGGQIGRYKFHSNQQYRFSLSGGLVPSPLISRGDRLRRDFRQDFARGRVQVNPPSVPGLLVAADAAVRYDRDTVTPATSPGNFNAFMQELASDTLAVTVPVTAARTELRHWNAGAGVGYRFTPRVQAGVEGHRYNNAWDNGVDLHKRQRITELRGGVEVGLTPTWTGRLGGYHILGDDDVFTAHNETVQNAVTLGVGFAPPRSRFHHTVDAGVEIGRRSTNYPDPTDTTGRVFRFVLYNRWAF